MISIWHTLHLFCMVLLRKRRRGNIALVSTLPVPDCLNSGCNTWSPGVWRTESLNKQGKKGTVKAQSLQRVMFHLAANCAFSSRSAFGTPLQLWWTSHAAHHDLSREVPKSTVEFQCSGQTATPSSTYERRTNSTCMKQLGSARRGLKFRPSRTVTTCWCHSIGALRYPHRAESHFHTSSSHKADSSGGSANKSWSMLACRHAV